MNLTLSETRRLVLSRRGPCHVSYHYFISAINETLSELDISWNHLRGKGALAVAVGVKVRLVDVFKIYHAIISGIKMRLQ